MSDSPVHALIAVALESPDPDLRKLAESALESIAPGVSPAVFLADRSVTERYAGLLERLSD